MFSALMFLLALLILLFIRLIFIISFSVGQVVLSNGSKEWRDLESDEESRNRDLHHWRGMASKFLSWFLLIEI